MLSYLYYILGKLHLLFNAQKKLVSSVDNSLVVLLSPVIEMESENRDAAYLCQQIAHEIYSK